MRKLIGLVLTVIAATAVWTFWKHYRIEGLTTIKLMKRDESESAGGSSYVSVDAPAVDRQGDSIRIASFNIQTFGSTKLSKPHVLAALARIVRQYDVIAIQEIRAKEQDILPRFIAKINEEGLSYDYVIGERLGRTHSKEQYAFVFNRASVEVDRNQMYTVSDPDDLLHREPLVAWFRVRGPDPEAAFTFTLINIHTDPDEAGSEVAALRDVFDLVRNDGRGEDDVILLGDLNVDDQHLGPLAENANIEWTVSGTPTNTRGSAQYDNVLFDRLATTEFTGVSGVFDFLREFNLSMDEALEVSDHLPVWAEFSIYEGGAGGRVAERPRTSER
ncbi:MAG: endonuclease/exonuclease/phosphatase family protein [Pirellulaceae bacterium]|jgi:endonuclease/exonuclease/phosphatase family metal-dependent hydrolase|nr:endonuclease/exonuclease/phosphatase family protein [Pirellulaceae bacterium]MDP7020470.1 endonuclease/exonuclease/phosphatase family protein [Pirellulaceae bacterium]